MTTLAPGKLILSGEHAVVYGNPALAIAINQFVETCITVLKEPKLSIMNHTLNSKIELPIRQLHELKTVFEKRYKQFKDKKLDIKHVLTKANDLILYTIARLLEQADSKVRHGLHLSSKSTLPIGCGLGSSAATILSVLTELSDLLGIHQNPDHHIELATEIEHLQHGFSSSLDIHTSIHTGGILFQNGHSEHRDIPEFSFHVVNTGTPLSTTGECVEGVSNIIQQGNRLSHFAEATLQIDEGLRLNELNAVYQGIRNNHRLLCEIQVVPTKVQAFIDDIEQVGGCAKVCGAGSLQGNNAGVVFILCPDHLLSPICKKFNYTTTELSLYQNSSN